MEPFPRCSSGAVPRRVTPECRALRASELESLCPISSANLADLRKVCCAQGYFCLPPAFSSGFYCHVGGFS